MNKQIINSNQEFKYPIGKCKALQCYLNKKHEENKELIGYSFFNVQIIDKGRVYPSGEKEKVPTCWECYLYEKPMMEDRMDEGKIRNPGILPYKWFWFYNEEDEKKYWWKYLAWNEKP